jgi:hypothetical protein
LINENLQKDINSGNGRQQIITGGKQQIISGGVQQSSSSNQQNISPKVKQ